MENPFALIDRRLDTIEGLLLEIKHQPIKYDEPKEKGRAMDIDAFCEFTGLAKATVYKLTSAGEVPHYKRGKKIWFDRDEVEAWLLNNRRGTTAEAEKEATDFISQSANGRGYRQKNKKNG